jgi:MFS family permease
MLSASPLRYRVAVGGFFFICGSTFATWASRIPTVKASLDLNEAELGSVLFLLPMGSIAVLLPAGWAINKYGSRIMTILMACCYTLSLLLIPFCTTAGQLSIALFLFGFFGNGLNIAMNTQALQVQDSMYRKPLMSSFHALWSAGAMVGALTGGWMMRSGASLMSHYTTVAIFQVVVYVMLYSFLVKNDVQHPGKKVFQWPDKALWLLGIICFCCTLCEGAMADWSSLYYMQVVSAVNKVSTTGYTAFALMMALGRLTGDKLIDRFGAKQVLMADGFLIAIGLGLALSLPHYIPVIIGFGMVGVGVATVIPIVYTLASKNEHLPPAASLAAVSSIGFTGFLIGPPVIGFVAHAIGLRMALMIVIVLALTSVMLSRKVKS